MYFITVHCSVYGCGGEYQTIKERIHTTNCPKCGFSGQQIDDMGTNDPEELKKYCGFCRGKCKGEHYISPSTYGY